jgi:hypothetical protein
MGSSTGQERREGKALMKKGTERRWKSRRRRRYKHCSPVRVHCKKRLLIFPSPGGVSLTKLSLDGNNKIFPRQGECGTGKSINILYSVGTSERPGRNGLSFVYSKTVLIKIRQKPGKGSPD